MPDKRIALVTGANQGVGLQVAKELVANGVTVLVGSRHFERGEAAAREIGAGAIASFRAGFFGMRSSSIAYSKDAFKYVRTCLTADLEYPSSAILFTNN